MSHSSRYGTAARHSNSSPIDIRSAHLYRHRVPPVTVQSNISRHDAVLKANQLPSTTPEGIGACAMHILCESLSSVSPLRFEVLEPHTIEEMPA